MWPKRASWLVAGSLACCVEELGGLVGWWWLSEWVDGCREKADRLIVSPHATRRKREVVVVHGEVSRVGEDLTSRQTDRRSCPTRSGCGCRCSAVPTEPPKDSTPYPGLGLSCLSGRLSGRQCLSHSHRLCHFCRSGSVGFQGSPDR